SLVRLFGSSESGPPCPPSFASPRRGLPRFARRHAPIHTSRATADRRAATTIQRGGGGDRGPRRRLDPAGKRAMVQNLDSKAFQNGNGEHSRGASADARTLVWRFLGCGRPRRPAGMAPANRTWTAATWSRDDNRRDDNRRDDHGLGER